jgi:F0F1-type ATP synthase assembly protein I
MADSPEPKPEPQTVEEALARRLEELRSGANVDQAREELVGLDAEFDKRFEEIQKKAHATQESRRKEQAEQERVWKSERETARGAGVGLQIAYMIMGLPLVFAGIGYGLDQWQKTTFFMGAGALIGATIGVTMAIVILNRTNSK